MVLIEQIIPKIYLDLGLHTLTLQNLILKEKRNS